MTAILNQLKIQLVFTRFYCIFYQSNTSYFFALKTFILCQYHHVLRCGTQSPSTDIFFCTLGSPLPFPGVASRSPLSTPIQTQMIHGARHPTQHRMPCEVDRPSHRRGGGWRCGEEGLSGPSHLRPTVLRDSAVLRYHHHMQRFRLPLSGAEKMEGKRSGCFWTGVRVFPAKFKAPPAPPGWQFWQFQDLRRCALQ